VNGFTIFNLAKSPVLSNETRAVLMKNGAGVFGWERSVGRMAFDTGGSTHGLKTRVTRRPLSTPIT